MSEMTEKPTLTIEWRNFVIEVLRGDTPAISHPNIHDDDSDRFVGFVVSNGVQNLFLEALESSALTHLVPDKVIGKLVVARRVSSLTEIYRLGNLRSTLGVFAENRVNCLLLKGTALAYGLYEHAYLRPRIDTDLLIHPEDQFRAKQLLVKSGLEESVSVKGEVISNQVMFSVLENNYRHIYDVHWKISNSHAYADRFEFEDLYQRRVPIPGIASNAYRLDQVDAVLHAIVHYFGHYSSERERLLWIYDMDYLISGFSPQDWQELARRSSKMQIGALCHEAFRLCSHTFGTKIPADMSELFSQSITELKPIEQARISGKKWSRIDQFRSDWAALDNKKRYLLLKEYLFPSTEFIYKQSNSTRKALIPYFYAKRIITGAIRVIKNQLKKD